MSTLIIFGVGLFVTAITATAVIFVGVSEAADPDLSRRDDLTDWEWKQIHELREKNKQESES